MFGDSVIFGEVGWWVGNINGLFLCVDAGGYDDVIVGCYCLCLVEVHIGGGVVSMNFVCLGARIMIYFSDGKFKLGLDFYSDAAGNKG